jgi:hypothetical protein
MTRKFFISLIHKLKVLVALTCSLVFSSTQVLAQATMQVFPYSGLQMASTDALNFTVLYTSAEPVQVAFTTTIKNEMGKPLVVLNSQNHILKQGPNMFSPSTYKVVGLKYLDPQVGKTERTTHYLPPGNYTYCITMRCTDKPEVCQRLLSLEINQQECASVTLENVTPLLLSIPLDEDIIKEKRPNFTWIPPMPIGNDPDIRYTLTLTKMLEDQTPEDAIRRNRALYQRKGLQGQFMMFPSTLPDLEEGEKYAWQVKAYIGRKRVATSEVWEFEVEKEVEYSGPYININRQLKGIKTCRDTLHILYHEYHLDREITFSILDESGKEINTTGFVYEVKKGPNKLDLALEELSIEKDKVYTLVILTAKEEELKVRFQWR